MGEIDPITQEEIPSDRLLSFEQLGRVFYFDVDSLSRYVDTTGKYDNPLNRQPLPGAIISAINQYIASLHISVIFRFPSGDNLQMNIRRDMDIGDLIIKYFTSRGDLLDIAERDIYTLSGSIYRYSLDDPIYTMDIPIVLIDRDFLTGGHRSFAIDALYAYAGRKHIDWLVEHIEIPYISFVCIFGDTYERFNMYREYTVGDAILAYHHKTQTLQRMGSFDIIIALESNDINLYSYDLDTPIGDIISQPISEMELSAVLVDDLDYDYPMADHDRFVKYSNWAKYHNLSYVSRFLPNAYQFDMSLQSEDVNGGTSAIEIILKIYAKYDIISILGIYDVIIRSDNRNEGFNLFKYSPFTKIQDILGSNDGHFNITLILPGDSDPNNTTQDERYRYLTDFAAENDIGWILDILNL